jgi:hypothetical protein
MNIAQQYHDAGVYKFAETIDIVNDGWKASVSKYKYNFKIYSSTSARQNIKKIPLLGGRMLEQFSPSLSSANPVNEFEFYGLSTTDIKNNWTNNFNINVVLANPTLQNAKPTVTQTTGTGIEACGGWLIWKSRFSGWMFWGFDLKNRSFNKKYEGRLEVGMFESTADVGGKPYIPVDYTGISSSYTINLKSLGLSSAELLAVAGIHSSPAAYYSEPGSTKLELMQISSATTPINNLAHGGDFSVSLKSISTTVQKTK